MGGRPGFPPRTDAMAMELVGLGLARSFWTFPEQSELAPYCCFVPGTGRIWVTGVGDSSVHEEIVVDALDWLRACIPRISE